MMAYSMISHILILLVVSTASAHYITNSTDAFHDVLHFVNGPFSVETKLNAESLEEIYHELFEKGDCEDNSANCSICIDGFRNMTAAEITSIDEWNDASTCLLYALLDMSAFCQLTFDERSNLDCEDALLDALNATDSTVIGEEEYHMFLHALEHHFSGGEEHHDEHEGEEEHHDEDEEEEEHDDHDHEEEGHHESTRCFGEGTLLYHLGLDHEEELPLSDLPVVSGVLIAFLAQDMIVNEACAVEPSQTDILKDLFSAIGDGDAISEEGFESLLETLALGSIPGATVEEEEEEGHEGHDHKRSIRKRALSYQRLNKRSADDEPAVTAQCMSEATLASVYGLDLEDGISKTQFLQLCPALIQQKVGGHCDPPAATTAPPVTAPEATQAQVYGYGVLAVIIISLTAVAGAFLIPFLHKQVIMYVLDLFVAMGVSTMLADALLHLLPQALGLHDHGAHEEHADEGVHVAEYTIVQVVACISIYAFFIFESVMSKLRPRSDVAPGHGHSHAIDMGRDSKAMEGDAEETGSSSKDAWGNKKENDGDTDSETKKPGIAPLALMILVGDGIHNFIDGLALGAAFTSSLQEGLGTSIAIFCHELPHELGDFSILIQSGMSKGKAILFNLLSASTCLIGLFVGIALGADEKIRTYLIALTAGMFIYIALTDMLPSLMTPRKEGKWWIYFLLQNIGIIMGISLMLVISVYEEQLIHMD